MWGESDMTAASLRAISPRDSSTIAEAAEDGTRRDLLVALRDRIAQALDNQAIGGRDLASLSLRLLEIAREIEAIDAEDADDDIGRAAATPDEEWAAT